MFLHAHGDDTPVGHPNRVHYTVCFAMNIRRTRLAPSPTGALHLGNARTFALTWALARNEGWEVLLRIEDLDFERVKPGAMEETLEILAWLGLDHDGELAVQRDDLEPFHVAMQQLAVAGHIFRCERSRKDVRLATSAPHAEDGEIRFEPSLRPNPSSRTASFTDDHANHRLIVDPGSEVIVDELSGKHAFDPGREVGDFLVWMKLGVPSYQLAVVVDDARYGISDVVRGDDLLPSAARQQILYRLLGASAPRWWHLPLVYGDDGERLAKRHDHTSLAQLRAAGVRRERVLGLLAERSGLLAVPTELSLEDFRTLVTVDTLRAMTTRELASVEAQSRIRKDDLQWLYDRSD